MSKDKSLTVTLYIGDELIDKLTPEQCERIAAKLSAAMSTYYTAHPEEYQKVQEK